MLKIYLYSLSLEEFEFLSELMFLCFISVFYIDFTFLFLTFSCFFVVVPIHSAEELWSNFLVFTCYINKQPLGTFGLTALKYKFQFAFWN